MRYIGTNEITETPDSDLIYDNEITGVEYDESRVRLNFEYGEFPCVSTDKLDKNDRGGYYQLFTHTAANGNLWLIGQFLAKYEREGLLSINSTMEAWCQLDYGDGEFEGGESYDYNSINDLTSSIHSNIYTSHEGGVVGGNSRDFQNEQLYVFAVNITKVSEFSINWGSLVEIRYYTLSDNTILSGTRDRPHILNTNEFFQPDTKIDSTPIGSYIASNIKTYWKNGKQSINLTTNVSDYNPIYEVGNIVTVLDCRTDEIDLGNQSQVNLHSIAKYPNGQAKSFKITSAEFRYTGSYRQYLQMIENVEV